MIHNDNKMSEQTNGQLAPCLLKNLADLDRDVINRIECFRVLTAMLLSSTTRPSPWVSTQWSVWSLSTVQGSGRNGQCGHSVLPGICVHNNCQYNHSVLPGICVYHTKEVISPYIHWFQVHSRFSLGKVILEVFEHWLWVLFGICF